jgi:F0F1-type ATP synthase assembly protein I
MTQQFSPWGLALNIGWMIVTPIVLFGAGGVLLDRYFGSYPIFIFAGFFLAMTSGLTIVYVKTKDIISTGKPKK